MLSKTSIKIWVVFSLHLLAMLLTLATQMRYHFPEQHFFSTAYWDKITHTFHSSASQLLLLFLLLAPTWSVFITRKMKIYKLFVLLLAVSFLFCCILFFLGVFYFQPLHFWFVYAAIMAILGFIGIIYRVMRGQEQISISSMDDN